MTWWWSIPTSSGSANGRTGRAQRSKGRLQMMRGCSLAGLALWMVVGSPAAMPQQQSSAKRADAGSATDPNEVVLFPFDDYSIPLSYGLAHNLIQGHREGVVLRPADSGPDAQHIINHGSVLKVGDEFRIWYLCLGDQDPPMDETELPRDVTLDQPQLDEENRAPKRGEVVFRVCYAVSTDGVNWKRPALGLVKYG